MPTREINLNPVCGTEVEVFFVLALCSNFKQKKNVELVHEHLQTWRTLGNLLGYCRKKVDYSLPNNATKRCGFTRQISQKE